MIENKDWIDIRTMESDKKISQDYCKEEKGVV